MAAATLTWRNNRGLSSEYPSAPTVSKRDRVALYAVARGEALATDQPRIKSLRVLLKCRPLLAVAAAVMLFHLGNAPMLPLYGLAVVARNGNPFITGAPAVVIAQAVMVPASLAAMRIAEVRGYWPAIDRIYRAAGPPSLPAMSSRAGV